MPLFLAQDAIKESIVGLEFMLDNEVLVAGTASGELLCVSVLTQLVEVVGNLEGGLVQILASPDGELLAIVTGLGMLLIMTTDWEVLYEISLHEHTQLKDVDIDISIVNQANKLVQITWRSDGKYFATLGGSTRCGSAKELRIWERDTGALHSCSKELSIRSSGLDWIPNGSRLATAHFQDMALQPARIVFFERNGLERGSFDISGPVDATVGCLRWNCNSELFAVLLNCNNFDAIQIWSFSNYHWYLKLEWQYSKESRISFTWDPERPMGFFTWTTLGLVQPVTLCWDSAVTGNSVALVVDGPRLLVTPLSLGIVPPPMSLFQLKFSRPVHTVALHQPAEGGCLVASSLSSGAIGLLALPNIEKWDALEGIESTIPDASLEQAQKFPCLRLLKWLDSGTLLGVASTASSEVPAKADSFWPPWDKKDHFGSEYLLELQIFRGEEFSEEVDLCKSGWSFKSVKQILLDRKVLALANHPSEEGLVIHFKDGSLSLYTSKGGLIGDVGTPVKSLVYPSLWIQALLVPASQHIIFLGLDVDGNLQVDCRVMTKDCTSFSVHRTFINGRLVLHILYTTKQDILLIDNIEDILREKDSPSTRHDSTTLPGKHNKERTIRHKKEGTKDIFTTRMMWERGSRLVTAVGGHSAAVILQTLRGNLETIYPRSFVVGSIIAALCESKFNEAMLLARRHHINLNLLVDFQGWKLFLRQCVDFVRQVENLSHINELVCAVSAGNLADNLYQELLLPFTKETPRDQPTEETQHFEGSKIQSIMRAIRNALENEIIASPKRELCILTTMARSDPPELEEALLRIKKLREEEMNQVIQEDDVDNSSDRLSGEEALKHLLWLSDSKLVFNAALGLYDLHLAAMVAANSQGDPKEFLPLLQDLETMPTSLMKYTIDLKLQRYESALRNLAAAGGAHFGQCLELIRDQPHLFTVGIQLFQAGPEKMALLEAWGDYLLGDEKFEDAAAAFSSCSQLQKALAAYRAGGLWQCVLAVAGMMEYTQEEVFRLANELCEELQALGRPGDAAKIALEHCKEPEDAVHLYIKAREWMEAMRVAYMCQKPNPMQEQVQAAALECATSYIAEFQESLEKVGKYLARYLAVKERRLLLENKFKTGNSDDIEEVDAVSDVSSHVSGMSVYTNGTQLSKFSIQSSMKGSKQGRGKSRGGKIRAGSPGEEAALVEHLKGMKVAERTLEEIQKLLHILVFFKQNVVAEKVQRLVFQFQSSQHRAVHEAEGSVANDIVQSNWAIEVLGTISNS
ncbi:hypothetical protein L7F22_004930 [Adiantum nelumboides]|nr:hypothetical protein [Adiantum nelumboides]